MFGPTEDGDRYCLGCTLLSDADERELERHKDGCPVEAARIVIEAAATEGAN